MTLIPYSIALLLQIHSHRMSLQVNDKNFFTQLVNNILNRLLLMMSDSKSGPILLSSGYILGCFIMKVLILWYMNLRLSLILILQRVTVLLYFIPFTFTLLIIEFSVNCVYLLYQTVTQCFYATLNITPPPYI